MSDDKGQQEPSMEDILASIRRILSEDDIEEPPKQAAKPAPVKAAPPPPPPPEPEPEEEEEDVLELDDSMIMAEPEPEPEPEDDTLDLAQFAQDVGSPEPEFEPEPEPEPEPEVDFDSMFQPEVRPMFAAEAPEPEPEEGLLASPVAEASTAALTELARAVARERGIGLGTRGVTLEDMVREILRPILKDWLDQNLPYMVERIVRKEIERLVNRAEKP